MLQYAVSDYERHFVSERVIFEPDADSVQIRILYPFRIPPETLPFAQAYVSTEAFGMRFAQVKLDSDGEPVSVPGASSAEGDCGTVEGQVGRCWVSSASSAAEDEVRLKREALYRAACEPFQQLVLRNAFAGQCRALLAVVDAACSALLRRRARPDTARYTLDAPAVPPSVPSREVQRAMLMHILTPFMAVLAFALYALAAAGHDGSEGAREVLEGLRIRCGNDCDVRAVWNECLQWSLEADPTEGRWQKRRTRLYCLVAGYYLRFENDTEYERYLEKTPFRRCGSDGVLLSAAFQQLEFAVPVG